MTSGCSPRAIASSPCCARAAGANGGSWRWRPATRTRSPSAQHRRARSDQGARASPRGGGRPGAVARARSGRHGSHAAGGSAARLDQLGLPLRRGDRGRLAHPLRPGRLRALGSLRAPRARPGVAAGAGRASSPRWRRRPARPSAASGRPPSEPGACEVADITQSRVHGPPRSGAGRAQGGGRRQTADGGGVELRHPRDRCSGASNFKLSGDVMGDASGADRGAARALPRSTSTARSAT